MAKLIENHSTYTDAFRMLAMKHKQLNHLKEGAEDVHFVRCILSKHPMLSQADLKEFLNSIKNRVKMPFMLLVAYAGKNSQDHKDAKRKDLMGEFFIFDRIERNDWDAQEAKLQSTEQIGEDILAYLSAYYEENPGDGIFKWEEGMSEPIANTQVDNFCGTKFYFTIDIAHQVVALEFDESKFDNLTID